MDETGKGCVRINFDDLTVNSETYLYFLSKYLHPRPLTWSTATSRTVSVATDKLSTTETTSTGC